MNKVAFIVAVESNKNRGGGGRGSGEFNRPLEEEAIRCFQSWRSPLGNMFRDIPIYAICMTGNTPSKKTLEEFKKLNVTYTEVYNEDTKKFPAGWWSTPLIGKWAEENLDEDLFIHTDLDMILLRKASSYLTQFNTGYEIKCSVYSENFPDDYQIVPEWKKLFVTSFCCSTKQSKFYTKWYNKMMELNEQWNKKDLNPKDWWIYCNLEEHAVDVLYYIDGLKIQHMNKIQIGNGTAYDTVESLTDKEINNVYFNHDHFHDKWSKKTIEEYVKRRIMLNEQL